MIQWDGHWVRFFRWLNDTKYKKVRYWLRIKIEYKRLCIEKESLLAKMLDFFFPTLLLKMSHRKMGIEVLLSKKKEMNSCNFWVITIAQWPVPTPPSQRRKKKGGGGLMVLYVSFYLVETEIPSAGTGRDKGIPTTPLCQCSFNLGVVWKPGGVCSPLQ